MKSKNDFLSLLNFVKGKIYGGKIHAFELKNLNYYINTKSKQNRYTKFTIKKKSGEDRIIHSPVPGLKAIQKCINVIFQSIYEVNSAATGFVIGKSIVDNGIVHSGKNYVFNLDLKDFFSSIDQARVWGRLKVSPFNLNEQNGNLEIANIIASLCCHEMDVERYDAINNRWYNVTKNVVPQGAPTSPTLINIICQRLDYYLSAVAKRFSLNYTRYADDITFSSNHNVYQSGGEFITEIERIIRSEKFDIKDSKTNLQKRGYRQEVTGLVVNIKPNVHSKYIKQIRHWLYAWEKHGYEYASNFFIKQYLKDKINPKTNTPDLYSVLRGKLNYLKMVKGFENSTYLKLSNRFNLLIDFSDKNVTLTQSNQVTVSEVLPDLKNNKISKLPIIHTPKEVVRILNKFTLNNSALKYSTHTWDAGQNEDVFKDLPDFLKKANREFNPVSESLKTLRKELHAKIISFLFYDKVAEKGWGIHRVKFGWSSPELLAEMQITNIKPENFTIPEKAQFSLETTRGIQTIQKFKQVIDIFKNEIEIRDENSVLRELLIEKHNTHLNGFNIREMRNLENTNFFTDVDYFSKALTLIFENIQKRPQHKFVSYILKDEEDSYILEIIHHDSTAKGKSIKDNKLSLESGDFGTVRMHLLNLCEWSVESEFREGPTRINFLDSNQDTPPYVKIDQAEGFKYIFKFYK
ncbi:reverse transcriptase domain-containing protein [Chryseobacterium luteum]|uniref:reverse transcriptase domain-containing protein n=1 Tax=Chryseobacterium luteum TaxID=421531 RepID=UPI0013F3EC29|nr:reverse transcriptase domain-containing protein [Chryseobacterium luteum]